MSFELSPTASKKLTKIHGEIVADFEGWSVGTQGGEPSIGPTHWYLGSGV